MSARLWETPIYHPVLKHSRFAAKLRAGRYIGAPPGDYVFLVRFARVPLGQGGASSLIIALLGGLLLMQSFLCFWVYLNVLN